MSMDLDNEYTACTVTGGGSHGQQSLVSAMNRFVSAVHVMDETVMIPSRLKDMPVIDDANSNKALIPHGLIGEEGVEPPMDLYGFYTMLNAIKTELVRGPCEEDTPSAGTDIKEVEPDEGIHVDEQSKQTAAVFRHHLRGLLTVLNQMTNTADFLTSRYQKELGEICSRTTQSSLTF